MVNLLVSTIKAILKFAMIVAVLITVIIISLVSCTAKALSEPTEGVRAETHISQTRV